MQVKYEMSVSLFENLKDQTSLRKAMETKYEPSFELLRKKYLEYVGKVMGGEVLPGPGRLFYESPFARSHVYRFQVGIMEGFLEETLKLEAEHLKRNSNRGKAYPLKLNDTFGQDVEVVEDFRLLETQVNCQYEFFSSVVDSEIFPANLYSLEDFVIRESVYGEIMRMLQMTRRAISSINDYNLDGRVSSLLMKSNLDADNILSTGYSLIQKLESMSWNFSNSLSAFTYNSSRNSNLIGAILRSYHGDLDDYIKSSDDNHDFSVPVRIFNMYGPFAFLEKVLTISKHTAELRVGVTTFTAMLENGLSK